MDLAARVEQVLDDVVSFRRFLHENAELSMQEVKGSARIAEELKALPGMEVLEYAPGCLGILRCGKPGKTIALRADFDALPIAEESGLPFASKNPGVFHACGHDIHASVLLGCAKVLSDMAQELSGTIKFIFQPGEEALLGARHMLGKGVMENPKVDAIFAVHTFPYLPAGSIGMCPEISMASIDDLDITVKGKGGHGGYPHSTVDSVYIASQVVVALQSIISRETAPVDAAVISIGQINGGNARNIIPSAVSLNGTVRTLSAPVREKLPAQIRRVVELTAEAHDGSAVVEYLEQTPPVANDAAMFALVESAATQTIGAANIRRISPVMGGEDFACYLEHAPGVLFRVGTAGEHPNSDLPLHNAKVVFDEGALPTGITVLCRTAMDFLQG